MVCHGDAFSVAWRIAPHAQGWLGQPRPHRARASRASIESTFEQSENVAITLASWVTESSEARGSVLLNCSLSYLFRETSTITSTLERSEERHWSARLCASWTTLPSLSRSERRGNCFLSCLFKSSGTIVSSFERSETSPVFLALLVHHALACSEGCGLQVRLYLRMLIHFATVQGTDQEHHASFKKNTEEQA